MQNRTIGLFDLPIEITNKFIFSTLEKRDSLALRLTSAQMSRFTEENEVWMRRGKELGVNINSFKEYLMVYSFQRGLTYANAISTASHDFCKTIVERQKQFFKRAFELAEQIIVDGSGDEALAIYIKGYILCVGKLGVARDYDAGLVLLQKSADLGNVDAMLLLGLINLGFPNVTRIFFVYDVIDYNFPIYLHRLLLESPGSKLAFGWEPSHLELGLDWIQKAIAAGSDVAACVYAATMISDEYKFKNDEIKKIIAILTAAADKKEGLHSAYLLGRFLLCTSEENGGGNQRGVEYIKLAASRGNPEAHLWLGRAHLREINMPRNAILSFQNIPSGLVEFSPEKGLAHLKQAAPHHDYAVYLLGMFYREGKIVVGPRVIPVIGGTEAAVHYYKLAYDGLLDGRSALELAKIYLNAGKKSESLFFFERAAELVETEASEMLASFYLYGNARLDLRVDNLKADKYLSEMFERTGQYGRVLYAIDKGVKIALEHGGVDTKLNVDQFIKWGCRVAAKDGYLHHYLAGLLKERAIRLAEQGEDKIANMINKVADVVGLGILSKAKLIDKLITITPYLIESDFIKEQLDFLDQEMVKSTEYAMWQW